MRTVIHGRGRRRDDPAAVGACHPRRGARQFRRTGGRSAREQRSRFARMQESRPGPVRRTPIRLLAALLLAAPFPLAAQATPPYDRADTLRGSIGPGRAWWDVTFYDLHVAVAPADSTTMAKPVWIQIRMTIRKKLFQNGSDIQTCGSPPKNCTMELRMPIWVWPSPRYS